MSETLAAVVRSETMRCVASTDLIESGNHAPDAFIHHANHLPIRFHRTSVAMGDLVRSFAIFFVCPSFPRPVGGCSAKKQKTFFRRLAFHKIDAGPGPSMVRQVPSLVTSSSPPKIVSAETVVRKKIDRSGCGVRKIHRNRF